MNPSLPLNWAFSLEWLFGALVTLIITVWIARTAYSNIVTKLDMLTRDFEDMKQRNSRADSKTEVIEAEQSMQKTAIAVMAANQQHHGETLQRIENMIAEVSKKLEK